MPIYRPDDQRVVITGVGAITPLGLTMTETWAGLLQAAAARIAAGSEAP